MELPSCVLVDTSVTECREIIAAEDGHAIKLRMTTIQPHAACPRCGQASTRVHSRYARTLADLPWAQVLVTLHLTSRKFFCDNPSCSGKIFTERVASVAKPWARRTQRLAEQQHQIGLCAGGAAGARLCTELACPTSADTLIALIHQGDLPARPTPRVLGVDDWAKRKGQEYGTILVDHERGWVVDLLPDRTPETLAHWLREHPGVEIVTRDRAEAYARGIREGAPEAQQVADRWHLLKNQTEALALIFQDHQQALQAQLNQFLNAAPVPERAPPTGVETPPTVPTQPPPATLPENPAPALATAADERRQQRAEEAHRLHQQGWTMKAIARHLHCNPRTIRRYLRRRLPLAPQRKQRRRAPKLEPFKPYLLERWNAGCHNAAQLIREINERGFTGSRTIVRTYIASLREASGLPKGSRQPGGSPVPPRLAKRLPSTRKLAWLAAQPREKLDEEEQQLVDLVGRVAPALETAIGLAQKFSVMVCERQPKELDAWLEQATQSGIPALCRFASGLRDDYDAVRAALTVEFSNGRTEGHVNRLKCIKRQMYGRAKLDLLRRRVLDA